MMHSGFKTWSPVVVLTLSLVVDAFAEELPVRKKQDDRIAIIEARFGAFNGWVDVTEQLRVQLQDGKLRLASLEPVLDDIPDPAFGHHKALVVVYRYRKQIRTKIIPTDGVPGAWGSLVLPDDDAPVPGTIPVYLSTMAPLWVSTFTDGSWGFGNHGYFGGQQDGELERIRINGKTYEHSIGTHPRSHEGGRVIYRIGRRFSRFSGQVGITDQEGLSTSALTFEIIGDGRRLWQSGPIRKSGQLTGFDVNVLGIERLKLVVHCPGSNHAACAVWIEPRLKPANVSERASVARSRQALGPASDSKAAPAGVTVPGRSRLPAERRLAFD